MTGSPRGELGQRASPGAESSPRMIGSGLARRRSDAPESVFDRWEGALVGTERIVVGSSMLVYDPCMATKTISLEIDAYEKLRRAKRSDRESFSSVVRRARWDDAPATGGEVLDALRELGRAHPECLLPEQALEDLDRRAGSRGRRERTP